MVEQDSELSDSRAQIGQIAQEVVLLKEAQEAGHFSSIKEEKKERKKSLVIEETIFYYCFELIFARPAKPKIRDIKVRYET